MIDVPEHLTDTSFKQIQITLVDCPGHASLIRTIIGGKICRFVQETFFIIGRV